MTTARGIKTRFSAAIARWLDTAVIGVDPSLEMLRAAQDSAGVSYLLGRAEAIPLAGSTCDFAWLSTVICILLAGWALILLVNQKNRKS